MIAAFFFVTDDIVISYMIHLDLTTLWYFAASGRRKPTEDAQDSGCYTGVDDSVIRLIEEVGFLVAETVEFVVETCIGSELSTNTSARSRSLRWSKRRI